MVEVLPSVQVMTPRSQDTVPHWAPCGEPVSTSARVSLSLMNKLLKNKQKTKNLSSGADLTVINSLGFYLKMLVFHFF